ncbi:developmental pluripotency-associated protein 4 [Anolis carolinensis]|uniref:SAP domain-containing protein n=1 Tax=Anolis carolinensis TaxID=28377 RepID=A0A803TAE1_ANOCA
MPRQSRKIAKSASTPPQCAPVNRATSVDYSVLKRAQLQQLCKKLGIRATGKNSELLERVKAFHKEPLCEIVNTKEENTKKDEEKDQKAQAPLPAPPVALNKEIKFEVFEKKTEVVHGWCVVHGMILYRPESSWFPLLLRGGMVYVQDGENHVPFHLPVTNISVPEGLSDNYICRECVLRNQEKLKKHPMNQQIQGKGKRVSLPKTALKNVIPRQDYTAQPSLDATNTSRDKRRTIEIRKLYQPQEDEAYAQRVDGLLSLMARGELGMDLALRPVQPLVVHSPAPFEK